MRRVAPWTLPLALLLLHLAACVAPPPVPAKGGEMRLGALLAETAVPHVTATDPPTYAPSLTPAPSATATAVPPRPTTTSGASPTPALPPTPTPRTTDANYTVREGDSLIALGQRFGVTPEAILAANELALGAAMQPGRSLIIPPPRPRPSRATPLVNLPTAVPPGPTPQEIGRTVYDLPLHAYTLGDGPRHVVLLGGIHGGFEANTILLAYAMLDHFAQQPQALPAGVTLHIIPNANPDGLYKSSGKTGRFAAEDLYAARYEGRTNGRDVDLNRNWDCDWRAAATWRNDTVSGGTRPYSEPETAALRDYLLELQPEVVLLWHSAANGVFVPGCEETDAPSLALAEVFAAAADYPLYTNFGYYEVTGDAGDALAAEGIPALTVELTDWERLDWDRNLAGLLALLDELAQGE